MQNKRKNKRKIAIFVILFVVMCLSLGHYFSEDIIGFFQGMASVVYTPPEKEIIYNFSPPSNKGILARFDCQLTTSTTSSEIKRKLGLDRFFYTGKGIEIAVFDTGFSDPFPEKNKGIDYVSPFCAIKNATDGDGHGTMTSSIILEFAPEVKLHNFKMICMPGQETTLEIMVDNLKKVEEMYLQTGQPKIVSMSISCYEEPCSLASEKIYEQIRKMHKQGIIFVIAIGNCGLECPTQKFCSQDRIFDLNSMSEIITVGAVSLTEKDEWIPVGYSTTGKDNYFNPVLKEYVKKPDVSAPSHFIYTDTFTKKTVAVGTSSSVPVVSAVIALMLDANLNLNNTEIKEILINTAEDVYHKGFDTKTGYGVINSKAISEAKKRSLASQISLVIFFVSFLGVLLISVK